MVISSMTKEEIKKTILGCNSYKSSQLIDLISLFKGKFGLESEFDLI